MDDFKNLLATFVYSALKDCDLNTNKDASTSVPAAQQEASHSYTNTGYSEPKRTPEHRDYTSVRDNVQTNPYTGHGSDNYNQQRIVPESSQHIPRAGTDKDSILDLIRREEEERQQAEIKRRKELQRNEEHRHDNTDHSDRWNHRERKRSSDIRSEDSPKKYRESENTGNETNGLYGDKNKFQHNPYRSDTAKADVMQNRFGDDFNSRKSRYSDIMKRRMDEEISSASKVRAEEPPKPSGDGDLIRKLQERMRNQKQQAEALINNDGYKCQKQEETSSGYHKHEESSRGYQKQEESSRGYQKKEEKSSRGYQKQEESSRGYQKQEESSRGYQKQEESSRGYQKQEESSRGYLKQEESSRDYQKRESSWGYQKSDERSRDNYKDYLKPDESTRDYKKSEERSRDEDKYSNFVKKKDKDRHRDRDRGDHRDEEEGPMCNKDERAFKRLQEKMKLQKEMLSGNLDEKSKKDITAKIAEETKRKDQEKWLKEKELIKPRVLQIYKAKLKKLFAEEKKAAMSSSAVDKQGKKVAKIKERSECCALLMWDPNITDYDRKGLINIFGTYGKITDVEIYDEKLPPLAVIEFDRKKFLLSARLDPNIKNTRSLRISALFDEENIAIQNSHADLEKWNNVVKASWDTERGGYGSTQVLTKIFQKYGNIKNITLHPNTHQADIEFFSLIDASLAVDCETGMVHSPLTVTHFLPSTEKSSHRKGSQTSSEGTSNINWCQEMEKSISTVRKLVNAINLKKIEFGGFPAASLIGVLKKDIKADFFIKHVMDECTNIASILNKNQMSSDNRTNKEAFIDLADLGIDIHMCVAIKIALESFSGSRYSKDFVDKLLRDFLEDLLMKDSKFEEIAKNARKQFCAKLVWNIDMSQISFKYSRGEDVTKTLKDTIITQKLLKFSKFELKRMTRILNNAGLVIHPGLNELILNDLMRSAIKPVVAAAMRVGLQKLCEVKHSEKEIMDWFSTVLDAHFKTENTTRLEECKEMLKRIDPKMLVFGSELDTPSILKKMKYSTSSKRLLSSPDTEMDNIKKLLQMYQIKLGEGHNSQMIADLSHFGVDCMSAAVMRVALDIMQEEKQVTEFWLKDCFNESFSSAPTLRPLDVYVQNNELTEPHDIIQGLNNIFLSK